MNIYTRGVELLTKLTWWS